MFYNIFRFELRYRLVRPATYIYFGILLLLSVLAIVSENVSFGGPTTTFRNSPYAITSLMTVLTAFGMIVTSAVMSTPVYRDFEHNSHHLFFTLPISKWSYLGGRFFGSFVITVLIFTAVPIGIAIGSTIAEVFELMDNKIGSNGPWAYIYPFIVFVIPNILFSGAIFFSLATLSRKIIYTYMGNVLLLVLYIWGIDQLGEVDNMHMASLLDPFGLTVIAEITRYWTYEETNHKLLPLVGDILYNRLIWSAAGLALFYFCYNRFRFSSIMEGVRRKKTSDKVEFSEIKNIPVYSKQTSYGFGHQIKQVFKLGYLNFRSTVKEIPFLAIVFCGIVLLITTANLLQSIYGTSIHPVTYALLEKTAGSFALFVLIIIVFYSGELVWQERRINMNQIYDALPVPNWLLFFSKLAGMTMILVFLMGVIMLSSIGIQLSQGFTNIDFALYFKELFYLKLTGFFFTTILALLVQTLVREKFLGHFVMVIYFILNITISQLGIEHNLYRFNGKPSYVYSDMNAYGHLLSGVNWYNLYWGMFVIFLAVLSNMFWVRGTESTGKWRMRIAADRFTRSVRVVTVFSLAAFAVIGGFIYYNTNVLNKFRSSKDEEALTAQYEKKYKKFEHLPQPKVIAAKLNVDIFPNELSVSSKGILTLKNKSKTAISDVHLNIPSEVDIIRLNFSTGAKKKLEDADMGYYIYSLNKPLQPGDSLMLDFNLSYRHKGFTNGMGNVAVVYNGTFFNNSMCVPNIGYNPEQELVDKSKRKKNGLKPKDRMANVNDSVARQMTYISNDGNWIRYEATVSTSTDQIALSPGYLQKEWTVGDRRYFHYKMDCPILNFYSFLSARYAVKKDKWKDVALEIYYHPGHEYNLDKMMLAMKKSLEYYSTNFSPYQHKQVRIVEFPRYATFAQSFPNTIPYSESIGFIADVKKSDDIDYVFYVTAHEVAHQWWAHQVIGGNVQGSTLMSETMSQYSALMVMEKQYGKDKMRKFLKYELDRYLTARKFETQKEQPIMLCENQQYIHYNKGSLVMYALKDYIGEENLNKALAKYISKVAFQQEPFTNSVEFVNNLAAATPDSLKYLITDLFETITLYSNKTEKASYTKMPDGKYKVSITVDAHKFRSDSLGREKEIGYNDYVDIGVFGEEKNNEAKTLYLSKRKVHKGKNTFEIIVTEEPKKAGIDIYNKLIDRDSDDNTKSVTSAS